MPIFEYKRINEVYFMNKRNLTSKTNFELKEWGLSKVESHPLLNYKPGLSPEMIKADRERFKKLILECPEALKIWNKFASKIKMYSKFPKEMGNYLYLNDSEITKIEAELMEALKQCDGGSNE